MSKDKFLVIKINSLFPASSLFVYPSSYSLDVDNGDEIESQYVNTDNKTVA